MQYSVLRKPKMLIGQNVCFEESKDGDIRLQKSCKPPLKLLDLLRKLINRLIEP